MKWIQSDRRRIEDARQVYRAAFEDLARKVREIQVLRERRSPDQAAVDAALFELEKASVVYAKSRDALAEDLLARHSIAGPFVETSEPNAARVGSIAQLRWELRGKPEGTANEDWNRAEEIVRHTTAA